jgi:hypothetical protein
MVSTAMGPLLQLDRRSRITERIYGRYRRQSRFPGPLVVITRCHHGRVEEATSFQFFGILLPRSRPGVAVSRPPVWRASTSRSAQPPPELLADFTKIA